jgi:hypothetical protein
MSANDSQTTERTPGPSAYPRPRRKTFAASGTFKVPDDISAVDVIVIGGGSGGAGGGGGAATGAGGQGAAGGKGGDGSAGMVIVDYVSVSEAA